MNYIHLKITEHASIEILRKENYSLRYIANRLNLSVSTISREIKRNKSKRNYVAHKVQTNYKTRKKNCGRPSKLTNDLMNTTVQYLKLHWSPKQIVGRLFQNMVCFKTTYRWVNANLFTLDLFSYLRQKGKRQRSKETRGHFNVGKSTSQHLKNIKKRNSLSHWEADIVVSSRRKK